jgi:hypothetical protein
MSRFFFLAVFLIHPINGDARPAPMEMSVLIRVATCDGKPVHPSTWIDGHVKAANDVFAPHGVHLVVRRDSYAPEKCRLITRADRHALAAHVEPLGDSPRVTVLVVQSARDLEVHTYNLMGVHWRHRGKRWIIFTARARPPVLAHELCHFFGIRHDPAGGNLMTPGPSDPIWRRSVPKPKKWSARLTRAQGRRLRAALGRFNKR